MLYTYVLLVQMTKPICYVQERKAFPKHNVKIPAISSYEAPRPPPPVIQTKRFNLKVLLYLYCTVRPVAGPKLTHRWAHATAAGVPKTYTSVMALRLRSCIPRRCRSMVAPPPNFSSLAKSPVFETNLPAVVSPDLRCTLLPPPSFPSFDISSSRKQCNTCQD